MEVKLNIILHPNQQVIQDSPARFKTIKAGKRFGKSRWACYSLAKMAEHTGLYWYVAPTFGQAEDIAWKFLTETMIPARYIKSKWSTKLEFELVNGSSIVLKGADNENRLRGPGIDGGVMDEADYVKQHVWPTILSGQLAGSRGPFHFISSPVDPLKAEKGTGWFSTFCKDVERKIKSGDKEWAYWYFTILDNPWLAQSEKDRIKNENTDEAWNREYLAVDSDMSGPIYSEFNSESIGEYGGKENLPIYRSLDWGINHPTVCLWAKLDKSQKTVYIYDEYVRTDMVIQESCSIIKKKTGENPVEWTVIDPSTAKRNSQTGKSDAFEFIRNGIPTIMADNRSRGYDVTKMFFKNRKLIIHPKCNNLIAQLRQVKWGDKTEDDCTDALRYLILRIHDYINGMNIFEDSSIINEVKLNPREMNLNQIFPNNFKKNEDMNWLMEEAV